MYSADIGIQSISFGPSSYLSRSLADSWGTTVDFTTSFLHSPRFSAFRSLAFHSRPVHSLMLSSHRFLCLLLRLPPWTVPCGIVFASPDDRVTCLYHFSLRLFTVVKRSSYGPMPFPILALTSSSVMWSLYEIPRSLRKHLISNARILSMSDVMVHVSHAYKNMDMAREHISLILELMAMFLLFQTNFSLVTAAVVIWPTYCCQCWSHSKRPAVSLSRVVVTSRKNCLRCWHNFDTLNAYYQTILTFFLLFFFFCVPSYISGVHHLWWDFCVYGLFLKIQP